MLIYHLQLLYVHIMFKKHQEHVKILSIRDQNKKCVTMKTFSFNF